MFTIKLRYMMDKILESYDPCTRLGYKTFSESSVENPKLMVLVDISKAYLRLPNYMNMGNDWKNRRRLMLTGEL